MDQRALEGLSPYPPIPFPDDCDTPSDWHTELLRAISDRLFEKYILLYGLVWIGEMRLKGLYG
jgi:hypothetical protein